MGTCLAIDGCHQALEDKEASQPGRGETDNDTRK